MKLIAVVLGIVGALVLAAGIVYLTVPAHSLPSFLGAIHHSSAHRTKRGDVATGIGAALLLVAIVLALVPTRPAAGRL